MSTNGVPAVAGDTGDGAGAKLRQTPISVTAREAQRAPGTNRASAMNRTTARLGATSKPGRSLFSLTTLDAARAEWFTPAGPNGPCRKCRAKIVTRIEREDGAQLRVLHEKGCAR